MATQTANIAAMYEDVVADLIPYYDSMVLLPNPSVILNSYNIESSTGNTMKIPLVNAWTQGNSSVGENTAIIGNADQDFIPTSVSLGVNKRGASTLISEESLEDGGFQTVRNAVVTRLSRSIAQATDSKGMTVLASGAETAMTALSDVNVGMDGLAAAADVGTCEVALVFSPEAAAYAVKREPTVKMFNDIDKDQYQMVATVRNGFAQLRAGTGDSDSFIRAIATSDSFSASGANAASLDYFSTSVAKLRSANAPTSGSGFYVAVITPQQELALAKELNGVGQSSGAVGSLSDLGNQALLDALIGQAIGCQFLRSNNLPSGLTSV